MSPRDPLIQEALLRTVAFFDVLDYAPTWSECAAWVEWKAASGFECPSPPTGEELLDTRDRLLEDRRIEMGMGRVALHGRLGRLLAISFDRMPLQARKLRRARRVARALARIGAVRFVALANTTALGNARDAADLDFFVITSAGHLWTARLLAAGPYRLLGRLSKPDGAPDAVCLSYFISDASLDLASHMLTPDDPYFRYWFLSLLPLYDDGVGQDLWEANRGLRAVHPRATKWMAIGQTESGRKPTAESRKPTLPPRLRIPTPAKLEQITRPLQLRWFPQNIRTRMNADSSVIVSDQALKFHVDDARLTFRGEFETRLQGLGLV
jgi:hypothetical protein